MGLSFGEQAALKTSDELLAIYSNPEEYQESFVNAVADELKKRGVFIEDISQTNEQRKKEKDAAIAKGRKGNPLYIIICFIMAFLGGLVGFVGGLVYTFSTTRDSSGKKHYYYDDETRKKGKLITIIGFFGFLIAFSLKYNL